MLNVWILFDYEQYWNWALAIKVHLNTSSMSYISKNRGASRLIYKWREPGPEHLEDDLFSWEILSLGGTKNNITQMLIQLVTRDRIKDYQLAKKMMENI